MPWPTWCKAARMEAIHKDFHWLMYGLSLFLILTACGPEKHDTDSKMNSNYPIQGHNNPVQASDGEEVSPLPEILVFDPENIPSEFAIQDSIVDGMHYRDSEGEHYVVLFKETRGEFETEHYFSQLSGVQLKKKNGNWKEEWRIKEAYRMGVGEPVYEEGTLEVTDIDQDGIGESSFIYRTAIGGWDPDGVKLLMHVKGEKLAIRGKVPTDYSDFEENYEKKPDPILDSQPEPIQSFIHQKWDNWVEEYKQMGE